MVLFHLRHIMHMMQTFAFTVQINKYLFNTFGILEEHEPKAPRPAGDGVQFQRAIYHLPILAKVIFQVFLCCVPAEATNEHLPVGTDGPAG